VHRPHGDVVKTVRIRLRCQARRVLLTHEVNNFHDKIISECPLFGPRSYKPLWWLWNPLNNIFPVRIGVPSAVRRDEIRFDDGGVIAVDWLAMGRDIADDVPIVVGFPETGACDPRGSFCGLLLHEFVQSSYRAAHVVYEGHGGLLYSSTRVPGLFYAGSDAVGVVVRHIHRKYPNARLCLFGSSIGANHVANWAGRHPDLCTAYNVVVHVMVSHGGNAIQSQGAGDALWCTPFGRVRPSLRVVQLWKEQISDEVSLKHFEGLDGVNGFSVKQLLAADTMEAWNAASLPLYPAYKTIEDAFEQCDSGRCVGDIAQPILYLNADDDPICPSEPMRCHPTLFQNRMAMVVSTVSGAHLGWVDGCQPTRSWACNMIIDYVAAVMRIKDPLALAHGVSDVTSVVDVVSEAVIMDDIVIEGNVLTNMSDSGSAVRQL